MDIVDKAKRSKMMSAITATNTEPEMLVRRILHNAGFRYRLHDKKLPGTPDIVLSKYRAVIEVRGCFWHRHNCHLFKWPSSRREFWHEKLQRNFDRDLANEKAIIGKGWRILIVWECALKGKSKLGREQLEERLFSWMDSSGEIGHISGSCIP